MLEWIHVSVMLPKLHSQVLAVTVDTGMRGVTHIIEVVNYKTSEVFAGRQLFTNQAGYERRVEWWMPLPELPTSD